MAQRTVIARQGQTIMDICIQEYGDANFFYDLAALNGFALDHDLHTGDAVIVDTDGVGNQNVKDFYNRLTVNNKKRFTPVNYVEFEARDFKEAHFNTNDYS